MPVEVYIVALIGFLTVVGFGILAPSLPSLADEFNVGATAMSIAISGFAAARLVSNLVFARYLKKFRLRTVLWAGLLLQAVFSIIASLATDFTVFITLRSLSGIGSASFTIASTALILVLVPPEIRGRAMAIFAGATGFGTVSGPVVGGALAVFGARVPFFVYGCALAVAALTTFIALRRVRDARTLDTDSGMVGRGPIAVVRHLAGDKLIVAALACQLVSGWIFYGFRTANLPLHLDVLGYSTAAIGGLLAVGAFSQIAGSSFAGPLSDRIGRRTPALIGLGIGFAGVGGLLFAAEPWIAIVTFVLIGIGGGTIASVNPTILGDSPRGQSSLALGMFWVVSDLAAVAGPLVSGLLTDTLDFTYAVYAALVLMVIAAMALLRIGGGRVRSTLPGAGPSPEPSAS